MPVRVLFAFLAMLIPAGWGAPAAPKAAPAPKECPHVFSEIDLTLKDMANAPTCAAALELFRVCGLGASGDTVYGGAVTERCEKDFLAQLTTAQKRAYDADGNRCQRKYAKQEGSMYVSFRAFCAAEVALKYARRYGKAAPPK